MNKTPMILGIASLVFGLLILLVSVSGAFWAQATPITDIGMLSTVMIFVLFGALGLLLYRLQPDTGPA